MKPNDCPSCSTESHIYRGLSSRSWVECMNPSCHMSGPLADTEEEAVSLWNRLAAAARVSQENERLQLALDLLEAVENLSHKVLSTTPVASSNGDKGVQVRTHGLRKLEPQHEVFAPTLPKALILLGTALARREEAQKE